MNELQHLAKPKDGPAPRWFHVAVAASMVISAISALVATLHTGRTMTALVEQNAKLVRAGSTPVLEFQHGNGRDDGTQALDFVVRNAGSGMARVVWFELKVDGKPMRNFGDAQGVFKADGLEKVSFNTSPVAGRFLSPGSEVRLFGWVRPEASAPVALKLWADIDKARFSRFTVEACFCSVFQECWTSELKGDVPKLSPGCAEEKRVSLQG
jgi:hypothetical protein